MIRVDEDTKKIIEEAIKLMNEGKVKTIEEGCKMAVEVLNSKLSLEETIGDLKMIKATYVGNSQRAKEVRRSIDNAIAYLENGQEDTREVLDTSKVIFILEQKGDYPKAYYVAKIDEERKEFTEALINGDRDNQMEEWLDLFQILISTGVEVLQFSESELWDALVKHNKKLLVDRNYKVKQVALEFKGHDNGLAETCYSLNKL